MNNMYLLQLLHLEVCESLPFRQSNKTCKIIWPLWVFYTVLWKIRPNKYYLIRSFIKRQAGDISHDNE